MGMTLDEAIKEITFFLNDIELEPNTKLGQAMKMAIEALEQRPEWIPVSERLPEPQEYEDKDYSEWVQITLHIAKDYDVVGRAYYCFSENRWYTKELGVGEVTAWMPLPEPYKDEEWMYLIFNRDKIKEKTEQWTKEAEEAGMTLTEYLESISPLNDKRKENQ